MVTIMMPKCTNVLSVAGKYLLFSYKKLKKTFFMLIPNNSPIEVCYEAEGGGKIKEMGKKKVLG